MKIQLSSMRQKYLSFSSKSLGIIFEGWLTDLPLNFDTENTFSISIS